MRNVARARSGGGGGGCEKRSLARDVTRRPEDAAQCIGQYRIAPKQKKRNSSVIAKNVTASFQHCKNVSFAESAQDENSENRSENSEKTHRSKGLRTGRRLTSKPFGTMSRVSRSLLAYRIPDLKESSGEIWYAMAQTWPRIRKIE